MQYEYVPTQATGLATKRITGAKWPKSAARVRYPLVRKAAAASVQTGKMRMPGTSKIRKSGQKNSSTKPAATNPKRQRRRDEKSSGLYEASARSPTPSKRGS